MAGTIVWRVGLSGQDQVKADLRSLGDAGAQGAKATSDAWVQSGTVTDAQLAKLRRQSEALQADTQRQQAQQRASDLRTSGVQPAPAAPSIMDRAYETTPLAGARQQQEAALAQAAQASQARINSAVGMGSSAGSAEASAAVFAAELAQMEQLETRAKSLKASIDPLFAAQQRYGAATGEADTLLKAGVITEGEHVAATGAARKALEEAEKAAAAAGGAYALNSSQVMELSHSARAMADAVIAGRNPLQAAAMESGRFAQVLGEGSGGLGGAMKAIGGIILGPIGAIGALVAAFLTAGAAEQAYASSQDNLARTLIGAGRATGATVTQLDALAEAGAHAGNVSVASATQMEEAFLHTGKIGTQNFAALIAGQRDFAAAMGVNSKQATEILAKSLESPTRGAAQLNEQLHFLSDAQLEEIRNLEASGQRTEAQTLLTNELTGATKGAADHLNALGEALHFVAVQFSNAWTESGKFLYNLTHMPNTAHIVQLQTEIGDINSGKPGNLGTAALPKLQAELEAAIKTAQAGNSAASNEASTRAGDVLRQNDPYLRRKSDMQDQLKTLQTEADSGFKGLSDDYVKEAKRELAALPRAIATQPANAEDVAVEQADIRARLAKRPGSAERGQLQERQAQLQVAGQLYTPGGASAIVASGLLQGENRGARVDNAAAKKAEAEAERQREAAKASADAVSKALEATDKAQETIAKAKADEAADTLSTLAGDASLTTSQRSSRMAQAASDLQIQNAKDDQLKLELARIATERERQIRDNTAQKNWTAPQIAAANAAARASAEAQSDAAREQDRARSSRADNAAAGAGNTFAATALRSQAGDEGLTMDQRAQAEKTLLGLEQAEAEARLETILAAKGVTAATATRARAEQAAAEAAAPQAAADAQIRQNQGASLDAAKALATTSDARNAIEREQLEIGQRQRDAATQILIAQLDQAVADKAMSAAKRDELAAALNTSRTNLDGQENEALRRQQLTPLAKLYDPSSQSSVKDMAETDAASGMTKLSASLVDLEQGTETFKKALKDVAGSLEGEILKQITDRALAPIDKYMDQELGKLFGSTSTGDAAAANTTLAASSTTLNTIFEELAEAGLTAAQYLAAIGTAGGVSGASSLLGQLGGVSGSGSDLAGLDGSTSSLAGLDGSTAAALTLAAGGHIRGPGSSTSDDIPVWASDGEFMVNAKATSQHLDLLHAINNGGDVRGAVAAYGYATGGYIGDDPYARRQRSGTAYTAPANASNDAGAWSGDINLHNHTGQPMQAKAAPNGKGGMDVMLTPLLKKGVQGMAADGSMERTLKTMPRILKTRA